MGTALAILLAANVDSVSAQSQPQPTPCFRWSGQVAIANAPGQAPGEGVNASTLWYYGGQAMTSQGQTNNLWTNALVALPLDQGANSRLQPTSGKECVCTDVATLCRLANWNAASETRRA